MMNNHYSEDLSCPTQVYKINGKRQHLCIILKGAPRPFFDICARLPTDCLLNQAALIF